MVQSVFGKHLKIEDGNVVAYDAHGNKLYSKARPGEAADFDEALEILVDQYPYRDQILKGSGHSGGGTPRAASPPAARPSRSPTARPRPRRSPTSKRSGRGHMAFDLAVFNKQTYTALTETVAQAIDKFNQASAGTIVLQNAPAQGDFDIKASFKLIANLVRRRNVYGNGDVAATRLTQLLNAAVKVAAGTPPIEYEAAQYNWVLQNPALAALTIGEQLGKARVADMLNTAIRGAVAAISGHSDATHGSATETATFRTLNKAAFKFGDRANAIAAWVFHSSVVSDLYDNALANAENLFTYDGVNVMRDPFGRLFVVTDADSLIVAGADPRPTQLRSVRWAWCRARCW